MREVTVLGAGLAGSECAWQLARRGIKVKLWEMKPEKMSPAHTSPYFGELVCSNSLRSDELSNAVGLLKAEMRSLGSLIMDSADKHRVAAGGALAVDREGFARYITEQLEQHENVEIIRREATDIPEGEVVIATGPLSSDAIAEKIAALCPDSDLHFYDAVAPIVTLESVDMDSAFFASRYGKGSADYVNCPMNKEEYDRFVEALVTAERAPVHSFDARDPKVYEGCMPIEVLASRGHDAIRFGPMKPVGLKDPRTGHRPWAVLQLRTENREKTLFNLVGFQTNLKFGEQKRVFGMIPGLAHAEFVRYGVMHRNTFLRSPDILSRNYALDGQPLFRFAGQLTGVEGYMESAASGMVAAIGLCKALRGEEEPDFGGQTVLGALERHVRTPSADFQPMNANFGILDALPTRVRGKRDRYAKLSERALEALDRIIDRYELRN